MPEEDGVGPASLKSVLGCLHQQGNGLPAYKMDKIKTQDRNG